MASTSTSLQCFPLRRIDEVSSKHCGYCHQESDAGNLLQCSQCRAAYYCSIDCQRAAWKAFHKHACEALKKGSTIPIVDFEGIRTVLQLGSRARMPILRAHAMNLASRRKLCIDFWSNPARLLFPSFEEQPRTGVEPIPPPEPGALVRVLDPMRLLQATCAAACHDLQDSLPDSAIAAATAYMLYGTSKQGCNEGEELKVVLSLFWQTAVMWTVALSRLIVIENADPDGERAARLRINRARALQGANLIFSAGSEGFAGNDARDIFAFRWPLGEYAQQGRDYLCIALGSAAEADTRRAIQSVNASPETRALAYLLFAWLQPKSKTDNIRAAVSRALAVLETGEDRTLSQVSAGERLHRQRVIHEEARRIEDRSGEAGVEFILGAEAFHIADSDDAQMGGGHCEKPNCFTCEPMNGCTLCQWRREREAGAES